MLSKILKCCHFIRSTPSIFHFPVRRIYRGRTEFTEKFVDSKETELARKIMAKYDGYIQWPQSRITFDDSQQRPSPRSHSAQLSNFQLIADMILQQNLSVTSDIFQMSLGDMLTNCSEFSSSELIEGIHVLKQIQPTAESTKSEMVDALWLAFSAACAAKCKDWDIQQLLYVCDLWSLTALGNRTVFAFEACRKFGDIVDELTLKQSVQALSYLSWYRKLNVSRFEAPLASGFDELSLEELSVAALGFFRTSTSIRSSKLVQDMYAKLLNEDIGHLDDLSLVNLIKVCCGIMLVCWCCR